MAEKEKERYDIYFYIWVQYICYCCCSWLYEEFTKNEKSFCFKHILRFWNIQYIVQEFHQVVKYIFAYGRNKMDWKNYWISSLQCPSCLRNENVDTFRQRSRLWLQKWRNMSFPYPCHRNSSADGLICLTHPAVYRKSLRQRLPQFINDSKSYSII